MRGGFHPPGRTAPKPNPWYKRDGGARLAQDRALISERYPGLVFHIDDQAGRVYLDGELTLLAECGVPTRIRVRVDFPANYPSQEPRAYDVANRFPHVPDRHFCPDGQCCLWLPPESRWNPSDPEGLCRFLEEVAIFFDRQLVYDVEGKSSWPGGERGHGAAGYVEFVEELLNGDRGLLGALAPTFANISRIGRNSSCPCGSGRKYKRCHLGLVEEISHRVGVVKLRGAFRKYLEGAAGGEKIADSAT